VILGIAPVGIGCASRPARSASAPPVETRLDPAADTRLLSAAEMESLVAFGEVLVEGRTLGTDERRYLAEHIEDRTRESPNYLSFYRIAAGTLDRLAGRRFSSLEIRERISLIDRHRLAAGRGAGEDRGPLSSEMRTIRLRAAPDLIRGYYTSPAGWGVVGYDSFPGRCGDLARYTRPET
jgi:hypothetical protein